MLTLLLPAGAFKFWPYSGRPLKGYKGKRQASGINFFTSMPMQMLSNFFSYDVRQNTELFKVPHHKLKTYNWFPFFVFVLNKLYTFLTLCTSFFHFVEHELLYVL
jgi:hypothetical protein